MSHDTEKFLEEDKKHKSNLLYTEDDNLIEFDNCGIDLDKPLFLMLNSEERRLYHAVIMKCAERRAREIKKE